MLYLSFANDQAAFGMRSRAMENILKPVNLYTIILFNGVVKNVRVLTLPVIGGKYPDSWHYNHMDDPRLHVAGVDHAFLLVVAR